MKPVSVILYLCCILLGFDALNTASAWYVELDNSDGDNIFEVWLKTEGDEETLIMYYGIAVAFDETEVAWTSEFTNNLPSGFEQKYYPGMQSPGITSVLQGTGGYFTLTEDYLLGTFTMEILEGATMDGEPDVWLPEYPYENFNPYSLMIRVPLEDDFSGGNLAHSQLYRGGYLVNGSGLDIGDPVPIPGGIWLLGSGLTALIGFSRRKKHT